MNILRSALLATLLVVVGWGFSVADDAATYSGAFKGAEGTAYANSLFPFEVVIKEDSLTYKEEGGEPYTGRGEWKGDTLSVKLSDFKDPTGHPWNKVTVSVRVVDGTCREVIFKGRPFRGNVMTFKAACE